MLGTQVIEKNQEIPRSLVTSRGERVILGGATQTSRKKHMLDEDGKTVLEVALGNKEHADLSLLREDSDGVSTLIKENQI